VLGLAAHFADRWSVVSTAFAVPLFAFFSAGVTVGGIAGLTESFQDTIALGIIGGLVLGKVIGITATTFLVTRIPGLRIDPSIKWIDIIGMAFVAGIGFTVSLLVGELSFGTGSESDNHVKVGVLAGSLIAAVIGGVILSFRNRHYNVLPNEHSMLQTEGQPLS
jgi:NhaA family Na+:H+ antiporter